MASEKWQDDGDDKDMCVWLVSSFPFSPLQSQGHGDLHFFASILNTSGPNLTGLVSIPSK